jgi:hypothetical protein
MITKYRFPKKWSKILKLFGDIHLQLKKLNIYKYINVLNKYVK